jgi:hypothetical protein
MTVLDLLAEDRVLTVVRAPSIPDARDHPGQRLPLRPHMTAHWATAPRCSAA